MGFVQRTQFRWELKSRTLALGEITRVMAIVNLTPDSFSSDGLAPAGLEAGIQAAVEAVDLGADIVDLGAESTRPGADAVPESVEQRRLLPVLEGLLRARPHALISVDTYHAGTALEAAKAGAEIVNDVSGLLWDARMAEAVVATRCGLVLMHTRGRSQEWKSQTLIPRGAVVPLVVDGLRQQMVYAQEAGIALGSIVIDPGFGFGKAGQENFELLAGLADFRGLGCPILAGVSRKSFLGDAVKTLQSTGKPLQDARFTATIAANVAAMLAGAHLIRVHDVQAAKEAAAIVDAIGATGE